MSQSLRGYVARTLGCVKLTVDCLFEHTVAAMTPPKASSTSRPSEYPPKSPLIESDSCSTTRLPTPPLVAPGQPVVSDMIPTDKQTQSQRPTGFYKNQRTQTYTSQNSFDPNCSQDMGSSQQPLDETTVAFDSASTRSTVSLKRDKSPCSLKTQSPLASDMGTTDVCRVDKDKAPGEAHILEEQTQVITTRHDNQDCYAILITAEMIRNFEKIADYAARLRRPERRLEKFEREVNCARSNLEYLDELAEEAKASDEAKSSEEANDFIQRRQPHEAVLAKYEPRYKELKEETHFLRNNIEFLEEQSQELIRDVLTNAGLVKPTSTDQIADDGDNSDTSELDTNQVDGQIQPDGHTPSPTPSRKNSASEEQSPAEKARFELRLRRRELRAADQKFEKRREVYDSEKARFEQNKAIHDWSDTQTNFDHWHLEFTQGCAQDLDDAEKLYDDALMNHFRLNPDEEFNPDEPFNSSWDEDDEIFFVVHEGYPQISGEEDVVAPESHEAVYHWLYRWVQDIPDIAGLGEEEDMEVEPVSEGEEWEVRSVGMSDTWSSYDPFCYRKRIDYWNKTTGRER
ncbi:MAG: hypothetical protein LQ351_005998 [Letrouitia transgressa]|nr:MAG: hypothetical protein LQ351_005998 [Letrouitia transgressa]